MMYRDPTSEAVERLETQSCAGCPWREWNPFNGVAWCDHPKWTGREAQRPSTKPIGPLALRLHRCTEHPEFRGLE
jgi:hypothetical protein